MFFLAALDEKCGRTKLIQCRPHFSPCVLNFLYAPSVSPLRLCLCRLLLVAYRAAPVRKFAHPRRKIGAHLLKRPHLAATLRRIQAHKHRLWLCCSFCNKKLLTPFGLIVTFCSDILYLRSIIAL